MKTKENRPKDLEDNEKWPKIIAIEFPDVLEKNENGTKKEKKVFQTHRSNHKMEHKPRKNTNKTTPRHIIIQLQKTKDRKFSKQPE